MHNHHFFHFLRNRELNELYASIAIKSFALALIGVFIPIYLYQLGYSFSSIFLFYAIGSFTHAALSIPSAKISARFGLKHAIFLSIPFLIFFFLLLYSLNQFNWLLPFLAIILGINSSLFWLAYHVDFSKFSDKKHRGKQVGVSKIIISIFSALGPLVGGLILAFFGFKILFILVSFLLLASVVPLFFSAEIHEPMTFSLRGFFKKQKTKNILAFVGYGIEQGMGFIVWPLFIFLFILGEKYTSLGIVSSLSLLFSVIFILVIGKFSDLYRRTILRIGTIANAIIWICRSFVITPIQVFVVDSFSGASRASMDLPFDALCYDKANKDNIMKFITLREMTVNVGKGLFFIVLMFITDFVSVFRFGGSLSSLLRLFF